MTAGGEHRFAAIGSDSLKRYGFQFHPEVDDTVHGTEMISNFVFEICGCEASWSMDQYLEEQVDRIGSRWGTSRSSSWPRAAWIPPWPR